MTNRVSPNTPSGAVYRKLQELAQQQSRPVDEVFLFHALEGFLARLSNSKYVDDLVLKGGILLAAFSVRRPTRDIDLQGKNIPGETEEIARIVSEIAAIDLEDGITFDTTEIKAGVTREGGAYSGVRVKLKAQINRAKSTLGIDFNVGDPIWPRPTETKVPRLIGEPIAVQGYPLHMVYAEKLVTAVDRGVANTRLRDFADIYLLCRGHDTAGDDLCTAINQVARYREVDTTTPLSTVLQGFVGDRQQSEWDKWRAKHELVSVLPFEFAEVVERVVAFGEAPLLQEARGKIWKRSPSQWV